MPKEKGPKKPKYEVREKRAGPKMSRGRRRFQVGKELREQAQSYTEQATTEAEKAGKRKSSSAWGSLIGSIGVPLAVLAATTGPIGWGVMAALAGGGALAGSAAGVAQAKSGGTLGRKARRKDVEVEKFYTEEAAQASADIKEIDKQTQRQAYISAGTAAALAAIGGAAKAGEFGKGGMFDMGKHAGRIGGTKAATAVPKLFSSKIGKSLGGSLAAATGQGVLKHGYGIGKQPTTQIENPYNRQNPYSRTNRA